MSETENHDHEHLTEENLKGAGQRILGTIEMIGGVLTGDPVTVAEGEFNDDVGKLHQDTSHTLAEAEHETEKEI